MPDENQSVEFIATLIYQDEAGWQFYDPAAISATHPEIAYHLAVKLGREVRLGAKFLGLFELAVDTGDDFERIEQKRVEDGMTLVTPKEKLAAFQDPRWAGVPHDAAELDAALRDPPMLVELEGLDEVPWSELTHAYGPALSVPIDLQRLASTDELQREAALQRLDASIIHQGDVFTASAAALPFLLRLSACCAFPNRVDILSMAARVACSVKDPQAIRRRWQELEAFTGERWDQTYPLPLEGMIEREIQEHEAVRRAVCVCADACRELQGDENPQVQKLAAALLEQAEKLQGG